MKPRLARLVMVGMVAGLTVAPLGAEQLTFGSYAFSDANNSVSIQCFDPSLGTLNSLVFSIAAYSMNETFIRDVDDSIGGLTETAMQRGWGITVGQPFVDPITTEVTWVFSTQAGSCSTGDDGDGPGARNGGPDEIAWDITFPLTSASSLAYSDAPRLTQFSGVGSVTMGVGPSSSSALPLHAGRTIEDYSIVGGYSGNLSVTYDYVPIPEPGTLSLIALGVLTAGLSRRRRKAHRP